MSRNWDRTKRPMWFRGLDNTTKLLNQTRRRELVYGKPPNRKPTDCEIACSESARNVGCNCAKSGT
jgi:hypothetical protein